MFTPIQMMVSPVFAYHGTGAGGGMPLEVLVLLAVGAAGVVFFAGYRRRRKKRRRRR